MNGMCLFCDVGVAGVLGGTWYACSACAPACDYCACSATDCDCVPVNDTRIDLFAYVGEGRPMAAAELDGFCTWLESRGVGLAMERHEWERMHYMWVVGKRPNAAIGARILQAWVIG